MLVAAAVCPAAPVLVPVVAGAAAPELDECRAACHRALDTALATDPDAIVAVGTGRRTEVHQPGSIGSLHSFGVEVSVALGTPDAPQVDPPPSLPASLTVGAWLLSRHGWTGHVHGLEVAHDASPRQCLDQGARLAAEHPRVALLAMADGSARRGPKAPGYHDPRSHPFDDTWVSALATPSVPALTDLDPGLCADLMMAGRAPLQVLAGAAGDAEWSAEIGYRDDPYGVLYVVATWTRRKNAEPT